jgi:hypothetical protein
LSKFVKYVTIFPIWKSFFLSKNVFFSISFFIRDAVLTRLIILRPFLLYKQIRSADFCQSQKKNSSRRCHSSCTYSYFSQSELNYVPHFDYILMSKDIIFSMLHMQKYTNLMHNIHNCLYVCLFVVEPFPLWHFQIDWMLYSCQTTGSFFKRF